MNIYIHDLSDGLHEFNGETSAKELSLADKDFYPNTIFVHVIVDKIQRLFRFNITAKSKVLYLCDRCLESYEIEFKETIEQMYQIGHSELDSDDEIELLPKGTREIDISKALGDVFQLNRPMKLLCQPNCKGLCVQCGINLNYQTCNCNNIEIDPRLQKLKMFLK